MRAQRYGWDHVAPVPYGSLLSTIVSLEHYVVEYHPPLTNHVVTGGVTVTFLSSIPPPPTYIPKKVTQKPKHTGQQTASECTPFRAMPITGTTGSCSGIGSHEPVGIICQVSHFYTPVEYV